MNCPRCELTDPRERAGCPICHDAGYVLCAPLDTTAPARRLKNPRVGWVMDAPEKPHGLREGLPITDHENPTRAKARTR